MHKKLSSTTLLRFLLDEEGQDFALTTLRKWIRDWNVTWMRWEFSDPEGWIYDKDPTGKTALAYMKGLYRVVDTIRAENPNLAAVGLEDIHDTANSSGLARAVGAK